MFSSTQRAARALAKEQSGIAATEFALLAPMFFIMFFGLFQVSVYLQNYNAVRAIATDGARYVMVEYQKSNEVSNKQIEDVVRGMAVSPPYQLDPDRFTVTVTRPNSSRISGATEITIDIDYNLNDFIPGLNLPNAKIDYDRPVFVVE